MLQIFKYNRLYMEVDSNCTIITSTKYCIIAIILFLFVHSVAFCDST